MSLPEYLRQLPPAQEPRLALFDADGTLWEGDIAEEHALWMIGTGRVRTGVHWAEYRRLLTVDVPEACRFMLRFYEGMRADDFARGIRDFWQQAMKLTAIGPVVEAVEALAGRGFRNWIVTGSPAALLQPVCARLPIERIIGMELEIARGVLTGRPVGITTAGEGKVERVRELWTGPVQLAAGNSLSDVPMLASARDLAWAVHPSPQLELLARERGWLLTPSPRPGAEPAAWPTLEEELEARGLAG